MYNQTKPGWDFFGEEGSFGTCPALTRVGAFCSEHQSWALKKHWWLWGPRTHGEVKVTTTSWLRDCPEPTPLRLPPMLFPAPPPQAPHGPAGAGLSTAPRPRPTPPRVPGTHMFALLLQLDPGHLIFPQSPLPWASPVAVSPE